VLTPKGWTLFGKLTVGDEVIGSNGKSTQVTGVFPRGKRQTFRVEFDDGFGVEVSDDHLWRVLDERSGNYSTISTKNLLHLNKTQDDLLRWSIPLVRPVTFDPIPTLPMDPYLFGIFVGCGSLESDEIVLRLPPSHREEILSKIDQSKMDLSSWASLKEFDQSQIIPEDYCRSSISNRLQFVQGIFDSRGRVSSNCVVCSGIFSNFGIIAKLIEVIQSLGGIATYEDHHQQLRATFPPGICPFSIQALEKQFQNMSKVFPVRRLRSIRPCRLTDVLCISVAAEDHLYVTEHFIVTHNTIQVSSYFIPSHSLSLSRSHEMIFRQFLYLPTWQPIAAYGDLI
jgi:hypothetical protein